MVTNVSLKRKTALLSTLGMIIAFTPLTNISANTTGANDPTSLESLADNDKVLVLPDGFILHGIMKLKSNSLLDRGVPAVNSETDKSSVTWGQLKKQTKTPNNDLSVVFKSIDKRNLSNLEGSTPASKEWILQSGEGYKSNYFSGSGWRFGGFIFRTPPVPEDYLLWGSHGDDGRVGTYDDAMNTWYNGGNYGIQVNNGTQAYFEGPAQYYSYNPKDKSYYGVANR